MRPNRRMKATVTAVMPLIPLDPIQEYLKVADIYAAGNTRFMKAHQLLTIEDMFYCFA